MSILVAGLIVFLGVHLLPAVQDWRVALVRQWGEQRYEGIFSLVSFAGLGLATTAVGGDAAHKK